MDTSYLKLMKGSRLRNYMGLHMAEGHEFTCGPNYMYLEIPVLGVLDEDAKLITEVKRNQHVFVMAAASVEVKGRNFIEVEPNAALSEYGQVQGLYRVHPGEQAGLGFWFTARKDTDLSKLSHAIRIYMPA